MLNMSGGRKLQLTGAEFKQLATIVLNEKKKRKEKKFLLKDLDPQRKLWTPVHIYLADVDF